MCASWPQACITPGFFETQQRGYCRFVGLSCTGSASQSGALLALPQHADHATVRDDVDAQLQRLQRGDDVSKRLRLLPGELRMLVQPPPVRNHLLLVRAEHVNRRHKCLLGETSGLPP